MSERTSFGKAGAVPAKAYMVPNPPTPNRAIDFEPDLCNGCNRCVEICRSDVLMPNPEKGKPPIVLYPDECWYCGTCVLECPRPGAITLLHPLNQSVSVIWKRVTTGEVYRMGMLNPPPPNPRPPAG
jgi:NAD-dependent dihydropyrimidine dehydrogenase PreA subunit